MTSFSLATPTLHVHTPSTPLTPLPHGEHGSENCNDDGSEDFALSDASLDVLALPQLGGERPEVRSICFLAPRTPLPKRKKASSYADHQGFRLRPRALRSDDEQLVQELFMLPVIIKNDEDENVIRLDMMGGAGSVLGLPRTNSSSSMIAHSYKTAGRHRAE